MFSLVLLMVAGMAAVGEAAGGILYHRQHAAAHPDPADHYQHQQEGLLRYGGRGLAVPVQLALPSGVTAVPALAPSPVYFAAPQFVPLRIALAYQPHPYQQQQLASHPQQFAHHPQQYAQHQAPQPQYSERHQHHDSERSFRQHHHDSERPFSRQHQEQFHYGNTRHH